MELMRGNLLEPPAKRNFDHRRRPPRARGDRDRQWPRGKETRDRDAHAANIAAPVEAVWSHIEHVANARRRRHIETSHRPRPQPALRRLNGAPHPRLRSQPKEG